MNLFFPKRIYDKTKLILGTEELTTSMKNTVFWDVAACWFFVLGGGECSGMG
jgi:hypothetical protein